MSNKNLKTIIETIQKLQEKIFNLFKNAKAVSITREEFMTCYDPLFSFFHSNNCSNKDQEELIKWYSGSVEFFTNQHVLPALQKKTDEALLDEFFAQWENFKIFVSLMKKVLSWLDSYALPSLHSTTLFNMSFGIFRTKIYDFMSNTMFMNLYQFLQRERNQEVIPRNKVKRMIEIYEILGCMKFNVENVDGVFNLTSKEGKNMYFVKFFETNLLSQLRSHYQSKSSEWLLLSVPEYISTALRFLHFEEKQADFYYPKSKHLIKAANEEELVTKHSEKLIKNSDTGVFHMLEKRHSNDLIQVFEIMNRGAKENLTILAREFSHYIEVSGTKIVEESKASKDPQMFTAKVITLKKEMDTITSTCFNNHYDFQQSRDSGFKTFINRFDKSPVHLAYYLDFQFSRGIKGVSENEVEDMLVSFTKLIFYLNSKDAFISNHRKLLCKRLINHSSLSFDTEKNLVSKLSDECGPAAVNPISSMLSDVTTSELQKKEFTEKREKNPMEVLVCSSTWPALVPNPNVKMPKEMKDFSTEFEQYYKQLPMYASKNLSWILSEGKAEMFAHFGKAKYILDVKTYQVCILLRFNERPEYTFGSLKEITGISEEILNEYLKIFTVHVPIMKRTTGKKDDNFEHGETISINPDFKSDKRRIPCFTSKSQRTQAEKAELVESEAAQKQLEQERELALDAIIVRIMKSRKLLKFNELLQEINKLSTLFQPQPKMIRKRIDSLIERDYLKRDDNDSNVLIYMP